MALTWGFIPGKIFRVFSSFSTKHNWSVCILEKPGSLKLALMSKSQVLKPSVSTGKSC